jgi:CRISPR-associated protein Cas2
VTVLILTACPAGLRGFITRWLLEISAGVFVGCVSARVRDEIWKATVDLAKNGRSIMVIDADNEQGLDFRVHRHDWTPKDFDGLTLMQRPLPGPVSGTISRTKNFDSEASGGPNDSPQFKGQESGESGRTPDRGWSKASRRRFLKRTKD